MNHDATRSWKRLLTQDYNMWFGRVLPLAILHPNWTVKKKTKNFGTILRNVSLAPFYEMFLWTSYIEQKDWVFT